jgi:hypothetical protein
VTQHEAQLEWERRLRRPVAAAAFLSIVLLVGALVARSTVFTSSPESDRVALALIDRHDTAFLVSSLLTGLGYLSLGVVLWYLFVATRHRRPELPAWLLPLIFFGPLVLAVATVVITLGQVDAAHDFIDRGPRTERRADALIGDISQLPQVLGLAGSFAMAVSLVLVSMNAMRVGLFTRFLGIIGVIIGALIVLPLVPGVREIVQIFWLGAVGAVILGFWPGGRGRAWETGEAHVWPSAAEQRRAAMLERREAEASGSPGQGAAEAEPGSAEGADEQPGPRRRRKKRRR